ncbi:MAG: DUF6062 family protein [Lachnospiraceae bacterium]|nr:DUF6062 family protein [Lachnospiraceae bacterium]
MKEQLYTIPVNDAFDTDCECPLCHIKRDLENEAIEFVMGPSYMQDDIRAETDKIGFCARHIDMMYKSNNRLGLALMMNTHNDRVIENIRLLTKDGAPKKKGLFSGKGNQEESPVLEFIHKLDTSCYVCDKINHTFDRYVATIFHLWKKDSNFITKFKNCKGFCTHHFGVLYKEADTLSGKSREEFLNALTEVYLTNMDRVNGDVSWFIDKFDYKNENAPWKNSRDALPRGIIKTNSTFIDD